MWKHSGGDHCSSLCYPTHARRGCNTGGKDDAIKAGDAPAQAAEGIERAIPETVGDVVDLVVEEDASAAVGECRRVFSAMACDMICQIVVCAWMGVMPVHALHLLPHNMLEYWPRSVMNAGQQVGTRHGSGSYVLVMCGWWQWSEPLKSVAGSAFYHFRSPQRPPPSHAADEEPAAIDGTAVTDEAGEPGPTAVAEALGTAEVDAEDERCATREWWRRCYLVVFLVKGVSGMRGAGP